MAVIQNFFKGMIIKYQYEGKPLVAYIESLILRRGKKTWIFLPDDSLFDIIEGKEKRHLNNLREISDTCKDP